MTAGGGGGGGANVGGGGGAAEVDIFANFAITGNLTVTIGGAGAGGTSPNDGTQGGTSTVVEGATTHQSALGGGFGAGSDGNTADGGSGGSGGGGGTYLAGSGGGASGSNTNVGGAGVLITNSNQDAGGGGSYSGVGLAGTTGQGGNGGASVLFTTLDPKLNVSNFPTSFGSSKIYLAGGGGGAQFSTGTKGSGGLGAGDGGISNPTTVGSAGFSYACGNETVTA